MRGKRAPSPATFYFGTFQIIGTKLAAARRVDITGCNLFDSPVTMLKVYEEIGDSSKRQILSELRTGPKNVTELCRATNLSQPNVSNHLSRLRSRGIVKGERRGRQVIYSLADPEVEEAVKAAFAETGPCLHSSDLEELAETYAKAAVQGEERICNEILDALLRRRVSMLDIYDKILTPAMSLVGAWYVLRTIDEGQEHMASAITERVMARTLHVTACPKREGEIALLGCAPGCQHTLGLRMLGDYLRYVGYKTLFLGGNVPEEAFVNAVAHHRPKLVLISASLEEQIPAAKRIVAKLSSEGSAGREFYICIGGQALASNPQVLLDAGADCYAKDLREFAIKLPEIQASSGCR